MTTAIAPSDPHVHPAGVERMSAQCHRVLDRLRQGPALNKELAAIALKYTSRVSDLRAAGIVVHCEVIDHRTGLARYWLDGHESERTGARNIPAAGDVVTRGDDHRTVVRVDAGRYATRILYRTPALSHGVWITLAGWNRWLARDRARGRDFTRARLCDPGQTFLPL